MFVNDYTIYKYVICDINNQVGKRGSCNGVKFLYVFEVQFSVQK